MNVLITGGTGTLGKELIKKFYKEWDITVFSRDELKQAQLRTIYPNVKFMIGDVKDYYSVSKAVRNIGLTVSGTKFRFHDLRHVFATWLHQAGVSLDTLRPLMGHRDRATTDRYATIDRLSTGKVLNLIPRIEKKRQKKSLIDDQESVNQGEKWQELARSN